MEREGREEERRSGGGGRKEWEGRERETVEEDQGESEIARCFILLS